MSILVLVVDLNHSAMTWVSILKFLLLFSQQDWDPAGKRIQGLIPSHPAYCTEPKTANILDFSSSRRWHQHQPNLARLASLTKQATGIIDMVPWIASTQDQTRVHIDLKKLPDVLKCLLFLSMILQNATKYFWYPWPVFFSEKRRRSVMADPKLDQA